MLTGATPDSNGRARTELATKSPLADVKGLGNPHHFLAGGQGALPQNSQGRPWLKVYEMVEHPAARALTGYLLVRGGVHQIAYARALENLTGANLMKLFPTQRIPTEKIPECQPHIERGDHLRLYRFSPDDYQELAAVFNGPHLETEEELVVFDKAPEGVPPRDLPPQPAVFAPDYAPDEIAEIAPKLRERAGLPKEPTGLVADLEEQAKRSTKKASSRAKVRG
jgi:Mn-containing catalase